MSSSTKSPIKSTIHQQQHNNMDKYQTYMLHSKTYTHNAGELTEICMEKGGMEFAVMMMKHYTKLVHSWLEENWNINDYLKEEVMKKLTASWFIEKIRKQAT